MSATPEGSGTPAGAAPSETVLVTGAAGTVGSYVVRELLAKGRPVIATDRPGSRFEFGPAEGVEVREGDLSSLGFCVGVTAGAGAVIHTAASIDLAMPEDRLQEVNVDAVRYLYESCRARGIRRLVHFSSGSIYEKGRVPLEETTPFGPRTPYERTKVEAESYLWSRSRTGPEVVVLRPTMVYGPRARFLAAKLAAIPPVLALFLPSVPRLRGGAVCNWVHAEDVARAAAFVLDEPRAAWEAYNVADDTPMSMGEVIETITRAYGLPLGPDIPVPGSALAVLGPTMAHHSLLLWATSYVWKILWSAVLRRDGLVPAIGGTIDRETFLYLAAEVIFSTKKLKALGFEPKWKSFREGYPPVLRWFQENRWVPTYPQAKLG